MKQPTGSPHNQEVKESRDVLQGKIYLSKVWLRLASIKPTLLRIFHFSMTLLIKLADLAEMRAEVTQNEM